MSQPSPDSAAVLNLPVGRTPARPTEPGWYICWSGTTTPWMLYWGANADTWRSAARAIPVDTFAGPIPVRKVRP